MKVKLLLLLFLSVFNILFSQTTSIPDANFENYLETRNANGQIVALGDPSSMGNGIANDNLVTTANINTVEVLAINYRNISDLTGIEDFTSLKELNCSNNQLTDLPLSQNVNLETLSCSVNQLTNFNLSQNVNLKYLDCEGNPYSSLDFSQNLGLETILCSSITLLNLNISQNTTLKILRCSRSNLTNLDVSSNAALEVLIFNNSYTPITNLDVTLNTSLKRLECAANQLTNLDISQNLLLENLNCGANQLTSLDVTNNLKIRSLLCGSNQITAIDLTQNTLLIEFISNLNQLTSLDVSHNILLTNFQCAFNPITSIDLTNNPALENVQLLASLLRNVNIKNGNNTNIISFSANGNPDLACILVDDETYSTNNWTFIDPQATFSNTYCGEILKLEAKIFLQGAYINPNPGEGMLMRDDLRVAGMLPITSPYSDGVTCNASVFAVTGNDAIVDWIWVELRDKTDNTIVVDSQSALVQRDGDIVGVDGFSPLAFNQSINNYHVVIKHRSHLGVMNENSIPLRTTATTIDFTNAANQITYGTNAQSDLGISNDFLGMWTGNTNGDGIIQYLGTDPDTPSILSIVLNDAGNFLNFPTYSVTGYTEIDVDMNGNVQYTGVLPDTPIILQNVLTHPGNFLNFSTYSIQEQLPTN
ncbi:leucine-rich repeat domain-containing protein [Kordia sp.]|uniref:leucine-rich repeat domain-containing protein n=1 Tax=Kordia sp. TaxID=1965332 RepID=UPI003D2A5658